MGSIRSWFDRWAIPDSEVEVAQLRESDQSAGCIDMCRCASGQRATLLGIIRSVTSEPTTALPRLEATVSDGTGQARVVWLGRRRIAGIEPGRRVRVDGRVASRSGDDEHPELVLYNPRYELLPTDSA